MSKQQHLVGTQEELRTSACEQDALTVAVEAYLQAMDEAAGERVMFKALDGLRTALAARKAPQAHGSPSSLAIPAGYVLLPKQCPSWLEDAYDEKCAADGIEQSLYLPAYDAMVEALEGHGSAPGSVAPSSTGYACHSCGTPTPPPAPYKFYVKCPACKQTTAASAAEAIAAQAEAEVNIDATLQNAEERLKLVFSSKDEHERIEALAYWLDQQHFRPAILSIAAADLRAIYKRLQDAQEELPIVLPAWTDALADAGFHTLDRRGFRVSASDLGSDDLQAVFYSIIVAAAQQASPAIGGLDEIIRRLLRYVDERETIRGIDPDAIHELHGGTDRECSVRVSDLRTIIGALACKGAT